MWKYLKQALHIQNLTKKLWSDSEITLCWIRVLLQTGNPIANHVTEIQTLTDPKDLSWKRKLYRSIYTRENLSKLMGNKVGWFRPPWLSLLEHMWLSKKTIEIDPKAFVEIKAKTNLTLLCNDSPKPIFGNSIFGASLVV